MHLRLMRIIAIRITVPKRPVIADNGISESVKDLDNTSTSTMSTAPRATVSGTE